MNSNLLFTYQDLKANDKPVKEINKMFKKAGNEPNKTEILTKVKRGEGNTYKEVMITFVDNQTVVLKIKQSGDIFQVLINKKLRAIKNQDDHKKAIIEISQMLDSGRKKYQIALAKAKVKVPSGIRTTAPNKEKVLIEKRDSLKTAIDLANKEIDELKTKMAA